MNMGGTREINLHLWRGYLEALFAPNISGKSVAATKNSMQDAGSITNSRNHSASDTNSVPAASNPFEFLEFTAVFNNCRHWVFLAKRRHFSRRAEL